MVLGRPQGLVGRRTVEAIRAGTWWQGVGGVESVVARIRADHPGLPVLLTGGMGSLLADDLAFDFELVPHLTLEGAASLWVAA